MQTARCTTKNLAAAIVLMASSLLSLPVAAQVSSEIDEDIWRQVNLGNVDFQKSKNYCQRLYAYYRYTDDGTTYFANHEGRLYRIYEGICELDIRYNKDEDDGADIIASRNLVHPDRKGEFMDFYELKPYTFLEKARRTPKHFRIEDQGDTTRVYTKRGLAGTIVRDTARHELAMHYNVLAPDTALSLNFLIIKGRLNRAHADAYYHIDDGNWDYVPQGQLKYVRFEGDAEIQIYFNMKEVFTEYCEIYVDSVSYLTRDEYKADKKLSANERKQRHGYTAADIDRLKQKLGVPPLTPEQLQRIEDQRDWEDEFDLWRRTDKIVKTADKTVDKIQVQKKVNEAMEKVDWDKVEQQVKHE